MENSKKMSASPLASPVPDTRPTGSRWTTTVLLLLAVLFALSAAYATLHTLRTSQHLAQQIAALDIQQQSLRQQQARLQEQMLRRPRTHSSLPAVSPPGTQWTVARARYLLELAQINAHWASNPKATVELLTEADALLKPLPFPDLFPVRQAIASDISRLNALSAPDLPGILSALDAAQERAASLPLATAPGIAQTFAKSPPSTSWHALVTQNLNVLKKLVIIQHPTEDTLPQVLSPLHQGLLRQGLILQLQMAQWAAIHQDTAVYQHVLQGALSSIGRILDRDAPATLSLIASLKKLQATSVAEPQGIPEKALTLLNAWQPPFQTRSGTEDSTP